MLSKDDLEQIGKVVDERIEPLKQGQIRLEEGQAHTNTALEALAAGQKDIREQMATKHDLKRLEQGQGEIKANIQNIDAKLDKKLKKHETRLDALEEAAGIPNPHKN